MVAERGFTIEPLDEGPIGFCVACHRAVPIGESVPADAMGFAACRGCEKRYKPLDDKTYARLPFEAEPRWWMQPRVLAVACLLTVLVGRIATNAFGSRVSARLPGPVTDGVDAQTLAAAQLPQVAGGLTAAVLTLLLIPWLALSGGLFLAWLEQAYEPAWPTAAACLLLFFTLATFGYGGAVWLTAAVLWLPLLILYARVTA